MTLVACWLLFITLAANAATERPGPASVRAARMTSIASIVAVCGRVIGWW